MPKPLRENEIIAKKIVTQALSIEGTVLSGGGTKDVATFGGAIGDGITIIAYQAKWYIDPRGVTNVTLG